ncbi:hypothetical protein ACO22_00187 [Paracoccidioides brasiliensis]|uniref:DUF747 family protein n=1 Tax=Paracoccidioides brasiliensis TaxID=121759 RepID=A0A1D2JQ06_PARBR|nr:hypothetical protein ACO22_00187 [Paracoccidioides brasiliensis]
MDTTNGIASPTISGRSGDSLMADSYARDIASERNCSEEPLAVHAGSKGNDTDIDPTVKMTNLQGLVAEVVNGQCPKKMDVLRMEDNGMRNVQNSEDKSPALQNGTEPQAIPTPVLDMKGQGDETVPLKPISIGPTPTLGCCMENPDESVETVSSLVLGGKPAVQSEQVANVEMASSLKRIDSQRQSPSTRDREKNKILKLSPAKIHELTSSPESLTLHSTSPERYRWQPALHPYASSDSRKAGGVLDLPVGRLVANESSRRIRSPRRKLNLGRNTHLEDPREFLGSAHQMPPPSPTRRRTYSALAGSVPDTPQRRRFSASDDRLANSWSSRPKRPKPDPIDMAKNRQNSASIADPLPSPVPQSIPLPPFSIPTYLQLELASDRPSPLYIHRSAKNDFPYESSQAKLERLQNFFLLPPALEHVLFFGTLACIDAWLYYFTILPLRFFKSIFILLQSWAVNVGAEAQYICGFIIAGVARVWRRRHQAASATGVNWYDQKVKEDSGHSQSNVDIPPTIGIDNPFLDDDTKNRASGNDRRNWASVSRRHRRNRSIPSTLLPDHKADILKGLLMIFTCLVLMYFDASRMYHWIRGQAAIKLYVIYNVLEVGDRLLSAIGQDVLECLFSREALERKPDGRSKILRPFWLFIIALIYTVIHSTALFYQVMTLNVAVNSYSNALITLLLSNQFVEIKSTVFKKFEKENLFQLTCADVVERFQLWLMLTIIASRNIVETGIFSSGSGLSLFASSSPSTSPNNTSFVTPPRTASSILPQAFTILPSSILSSLSKVNSLLPHVLGPFLVVLGSEMIVDWLKHAYINKFNNTRPSMYGRFIDVLAKDYYTNAFADQNLNRRLGLPVIPLACLFFRVSVQTYQMFLTSWLPQTQPFLPPSNTTSLTSIHDHYSPSRSPSPSLLFPFQPLETAFSLTKISPLFQTLISHATPSPATFIPIFTAILILLLYLTLLFSKLVLGIILLSYARSRYKKMKLRERGPVSSTTSTVTNSFSASKPTATPSTTAVLHSPAKAPNPDIVEGARRVGGWGAVEIGEDRRRWIYADDPDGARRLREREERDRVGKSNAGGSDGIEGVMRYEMAAKRIW